MVLNWLATALAGPVRQPAIGATRAQDRAEDSPMASMRVGIFMAIVEASPWPSATAALTLNLSLAFGSFFRFLDTPVDGVGSVR